jgi:cytochrome b561
MLGQAVADTTTFPGEIMAEPRNRYSTVSLLFHWGMALAVLAQVLLITFAEANEGQPAARELIGTHKALGLAILILTLARIGWRFANPAIALPAGTPGWQRIAVRATHIGFYVLLIGLPLGGWAASSAAGRDISFFGLFNWPLLPLPRDRELAGQFIDVHGAGVKVLYVLLALHVLGALKHHFIDRDNVLHRMIPLIPRRP